MISWLLGQSLEKKPALLHLSCILVLLYGVCKYIKAKRSPLNAIPTIGHSGVLSSYFTALQWTRQSVKLVQEGYNKYPGQAFKVATISEWVVVLSGKQHMEDIQKAPEDVVSFGQAAAEVMQKQYTLGLSLDDDSHHVTTIRSPFTRNLASHFEDIRDEIIESFQEYIPFTEDWSPVSAYDTLLHIVCRSNNRYFVGLPLCRDPGYCSLCETFTIDLFMGAEIINCFPDFLKPLIARYVISAPKAVKRGLGFLEPIIEARLTQRRQGAHWDEKPNDLIAWLLETATQGYHHEPRDLVVRVMLVNVASIHTSTMAAVHSLYDLAIHPEYVQDMRDEAEAVIAEYGWTKAALQKMRKIDSFLKESQRLNSGGCLIMNRKTLKDWRLSDGTLIPAGTLVGVASDAMNKEEVETSFPDAHAFKGFRFAELRNGDGEFNAIKHQMVSIDTKQIAFGYGRHACPGRFFAVNTIKAMFCHILLNYDVQLENGCMNRPEDGCLRTSIFPNFKAKVMFRKRQV